MFLLGAFFLKINPGYAWNPDYAYDLPKQRRMCLKRETPDTVRLYSISQEETCPEGSQRYIVVFGRNPRGSVALLPSTSAVEFYPPLTLVWPPRNPSSSNRLWHFTCVEPVEKEILESRVELFRYKGEITFKGNQDCFETEERALEYCQSDLKGQALLETCPIQWVK
jgi:hypothetical protein